MITIPASIGEVLDKISILEIKSDRIADVKKLINIRRELRALECAADDVRVPELERELKDVNKRLWNVEEELRALEQVQDFGDNFINLARSVYMLNDDRSRIKRLINLKLGSAFVEEKSYQSR
jgi:hypothetical protein